MGTGQGEMSSWPSSEESRNSAALWLLLVTITQTGHKTHFAASPTVSKELLVVSSCSSATRGMMP